MNPPIPARPCARCGSLTSETQSVYGVMHAECFKAAQTEGQDFLSGTEACDLSGEGTCDACQ